MVSINADERGQILVHIHYHRILALWMKWSRSCNDLQIHCDKWNRTQEWNTVGYNGDFHLFQMFVLPHICTLVHQIRLLTHTHTQKLVQIHQLSLNVLHFTITLYHVTYMMGKCIPKVLWWRQKIIKLTQRWMSKVSMKHGIRTTQ